MNKDFRVLLQAVLDSKSIDKSSITEIQKVLEKYHVNLNADINKVEIIKSVKKIVPELKKELQKITGLEIEISDDALLKAINQVTRETEKAAAASAKATAKMESKLKATATDLSRLTKVNTMQTWADNNSKAMRKYGDEINKLIAKMSNMDIDLTVDESKEITRRFKKIQYEARQTGDIGKTAADKFKTAWEKFGGWGIATGTLMKLKTEIVDGIKFIKQMDDALTDVAYTSNITKSELEELGKSSLQMAKDLNVSTEKVLEAVKIYSTANATADDIMRKSKPALMLANVSGMSGADSAKMINTAINQFNITDTEENLLDVVNTLEYIAGQLNYDFTEGMQQITEGIEASGSVAKAAGLNLQEYAAMVGLAVEQTGQSGSTIGNAYKTIFSRITQASVGEATSSEDISKAETALRGIGVEVRDANDSFRDMSDIMSDIGEKWNNLNDVQKKNVGYAVAGTRQLNVLNSLFGSWEQYAQIMGNIDDRTGMAQKNQEKYADSIEGRLNDIKATTQGIWDNLFKSDDFKDLLKTFNNILQVVEKITGVLGTKGTIGLSAGIYALYKNFDKIKSWSNTTKTAAIGISGLEFNKNIATLELYKAKLEGLSLTQQRLALSMAGLTMEQQNYILSELQLLTVVGQVDAASIMSLDLDQRKVLMKAGICKAVRAEHGGTVALTQAMIDQIVVAARKLGVDEKQLLLALGITEANKEQAVSYGLLRGSMSSIGAKIKEAWQATAGLGNGLKRVGATAKKLFQDMPKSGKIGLVAAIVVAINELISSFVDSTEEIQEKIDNAKKKISEAESEISSLDSQVNETTELITKMKNAGADEGTIAIYEKENDLLREKKALLQQVVEEQKAAQASETSNLVNNTGSSSKLSNMLTPLQNLDIMGSTAETPIIGGLKGGYKEDYRFGGAGHMWKNILLETDAFGLGGIVGGGWGPLISTFVPMEDPADDIINRTKVLQKEMDALESGNWEDIWYLSPEELDGMAQEYHENITELTEYVMTLRNNNAGGMYDSEIAEIEEILKEHYKDNPQIGINVAFSGNGETETGLRNDLYSAYANGANIKDLKNIISKNITEDSYAYKKLVEYGVIDSSDTDWQNKASEKLFEYFADGQANPEEWLDFEAIEDSLYSLSSALETATTNFGLLNDAQDELNDSGKLSAETIQKIVGKYPELEDELFEYIVGMKDATQIMALLEEKAMESISLTAEEFSKLYLNSTLVSEDMKNAYKTAFAEIGLAWDETQTIMANINSQIIDANGNVTEAFRLQWESACASAGISVLSFSKAMTDLFFGNFYEGEGDSDGGVFKGEDGFLYHKDENGDDVKFGAVEAEEAILDLKKNGESSKYYKMYEDILKPSIVRNNEDHYNGWNGEVDNYIILEEESVRETLTAEFNKNSLNMHDAKLANKEEEERIRKEYQDRLKELASDSDGSSEYSDFWEEFLEGRKEDIDKIDDEISSINSKLDYALKTGNAEQISILSARLEELYAQKKDLLEHHAAYAREDLAEIMQRIYEIAPHLEGLSIAEITPYEIEYVSQSLEGSDMLQSEWDSLCDAAKNYYDSISDWSDNWWENEAERLDEMESHYNDILDGIDRYVDRIDYNYGEQIELIDKQITMETALLNLKKNQFQATNNIKEAQKEIDKEIKNSRNSKQYLSKSEYERIFNEEDYKELSENISRIGSEINSLTDEFYNQIEEAHAKDQLYLVEAITAEYERQLAMKERELEIARANVDLEKKKLNLKNTLAERNIKQYSENGINWVADQERVKQAREAVIDAEAKVADLKEKTEQQMLLDKRQAKIDMLELQKSSFEYQLELLEDSMEKLKSAIEDVTNPFMNLSVLLEELLNDEHKDVADAAKSVHKNLDKHGAPVNGSMASSSGNSSKVAKIINEDGAMDFTSADNIIKINDQLYDKTQVDENGLIKPIKNATLVAYDSGGIESGKGFMFKDVNDEETVLPPWLTEKILTPKYNENFSKLIENMELVNQINPSNLIVSPQTSHPISGKTENSNISKTWTGDMYVNGADPNEVLKALDQAFDRITN